MDDDRILQNLHVLSTVSHNDKLMTNDYYFNVYQPTTLRGAFRMFYRENREQNVSHIRSLVQTAIRAATHAREEANELAGRNMKIRAAFSALKSQRLLEALTASCSGLENLMTTYRDDAALMSQMRIIVQEIRDYCAIIGALMACDVVPKSLCCVSTVD